MAFAVILVKAVKQLLKLRHCVSLPFHLMTAPNSLLYCVALLVDYNDYSVGYNNYSVQ